MSRTCAHAHIRIRVRMDAPMHVHDTTGRMHTCLQRHSCSPSYSFLDLLIEGTVMYHQNRPTLRTNWWKWRKTRSSSPAASYKIRNSSKTKSETKSNHVSKLYRIDVRMTCARIVKKLQIIGMQWAKCQFVELFANISHGEISAVYTCRKLSIHPYHEKCNFFETKSNQIPAVCILIISPRGKYCFIICIFLNILSYPNTSYYYYYYI